MYKSFKEKFTNWMLEILLISFGAIGTFMWGIHITNAEQQIDLEVTKTKVKTIEEQLESLRKENREDHKEILVELRKI